MNSRFETFLLTHVARTKLSRAASHPDYNLRLLLGHANVLDKLMLGMLHTQEEWKRKLEEDLSSAKENTSAPREEAGKEQEEEKEEEKAPATVPRRIQWANDVGTERETLQTSDTEKGIQRPASKGHDDHESEDDTSGLVQFDMLVPSESSDSDEWDEGESSFTTLSPEASEGEIEIGFDPASHHEWYNEPDEEYDSENDGDDDYDSDEEDDDAFGFSLTRVPSHSYLDLASDAEHDASPSPNDSRSDSDPGLANGPDTDAGDEEDANDLTLPLQRHHSLPDLLPSHAEGYDSTSSEDDEDDNGHPIAPAAPLSLSVSGMQSRAADSYDEDEIEKDKQISLSPPPSPSPPSSPSSSTSLSSTSPLPPNLHSTNASANTATATSGSTPRSALKLSHIQHSLVPCIVKAAV